MDNLPNVHANGVAFLYFDSKLIKLNGVFSNPTRNLENNCVLGKVNPKSNINIYLKRELCFHPGCSSCF